MSDDPCNDDGTERPQRSSARPLFSRRVWHLLREGDVDGRYGSDPVRVLGAVVGEAARIGMDKEAAYALIVQYPGGEYLRDSKMSQHERRRTFDRFFDGSVASFRPSLEDASQTRLLLGDMRSAVIAAPWKGPTSTSKVLLAHIHLAMLAGRLQHYAGTRRLATEAEVADSTVVNAHRRLTDARLLRLMTPARGQKAAEWKLPEDLVDRLNALFPSFLPSIGASTSTAPSLHPAFKYGTGLDHRTWHALDPDEGQPVSVIAAKTGRSRRTILRHLTALEVCGLALGYDDGTWVRDGQRRDLDAVAVANGAKERSDRQKQRFREQQQGWRTFLASRSSRSTTDAQRFPHSNANSASTALPGDTANHDDGHCHANGEQSR